MNEKPFLMSAMLNPDKAPLLSGALRKARETLAEGPAPWPRVRDAMVDGGPIAKNTAKNMIRRLRLAGMVLVSGEYHAGTRQDDRVVSLGDWPERW